MTATLSLALKVRARSEEGDALVHDCLADPQVVVDPLLDAGSLGELVWLHTGTVSERMLALVLLWWGGSGALETKSGGQSSSA